MQCFHSCLGEAVTHCDCVALKYLRKAVKLLCNAAEHKAYLLMYNVSLANIVSRYLFGNSFVCSEASDTHDKTAGLSQSITVFEHVT